MTEKIPPINQMDEYAILEAEREGPEAVEAFKQMREKHFKMQKLKGREPIRTTDEILSEMAQIEEELTRSKKLNELVSPDEMDSAVELIRGGIPSLPTPRPVNVLEQKLKLLNEELDDSQVFN